MKLQLQPSWWKCKRLLRLLGNRDARAELASSMICEINRHRKDEAYFRPRARERHLEAFNNRNSRDFRVADSLFATLEID
jgi:hypothetical protein